MVSKILVIVASVALVALIVVGVILINNRPASSTAGGGKTLRPDTAGGLQYTDEKVGTGAEAMDGKDVTVDYVGQLTNGTTFDSTAKEGGRPFTFTLGNGQVIKGWEQGLVGMRVGGVRKLVIPPNLAYGDQTQGSIPANSTLIFTITLLGVK